MLVSHIQHTMHIRGIDWQGRDYIINPSSHLQGWAWREQNRNLRHSECEIIWSKNISHPPPPLINVHQDTFHKYPTFTSFKANPQTLILLFFSDNISVLLTVYTQKLPHVASIVFHLRTHLTSADASWPVNTVCADDYRDGGDYSGFSLHWLQLLQLSVTPHWVGSQADALLSSIFSPTSMHHHIIM